MTNPAAPGPAVPTTLEGAPFGLPQTIGAPETVPVVEPTPLTPEEQRFAQLEQTNQQILQQNNQLMQMLMTNRQPQGPAAPQGPQPLQPMNFEGLPDAVAAPKDFIVQLGQRITQREQQQAQYLTHNITTQVARGAAMDALFNGFRVAHPELAKRPALLQGAALAEFQALQQQGLDPVSIAMQNQDSLMSRIAARMQQELGITAPNGAQPNGAQPNLHGAPLTPYSAPTTAPSAARVAGLQGGSGMPVTPRAAPAPLGFVDQLNEARRKSGLI